MQTKPPAASPALHRSKQGRENIDREVGARVRYYRVRAELSQRRLGQMIGVTFQQIQKYEVGRDTIPSFRLPSLCKVLEITPNNLYDDFFKDAATVPPQLSAEAIRIALTIDRLPKDARSQVIRLMRTIAHLVKPDR